MEDRIRLMSESQANDQTVEPSVEPTAERPTADAQYAEAQRIFSLAKSENEAKAGFALLRRAAEHGHPFAQYDIGILETGGFLQFENGNQWLLRAREKGVAEAASALARQHLYTNNDRFPRANGLFEILNGLELGCPESALEAGKLFVAGDVVKQDLSEAFRYFELSYRNGLPAAARWLGLFRWHGWACPQDPTLALQYTREAANAGSLGALYQLACFMMAGEEEAESYFSPDDPLVEATIEARYEDRIVSDGEADVATDRFRASIQEQTREALESWPEEMIFSVALEHPGALIKFAEFLSGPMVEELEESDLREDALDFFVQAAELGHPRALTVLADRYSYASGGLDESLRLLATAAARGYPPADPISLKGRKGGFRDERQLEKPWLLHLANAGDVNAQFELGHQLYVAGKNEEAFKWMLRAAHRGHPQAQERISFLFSVGEGCKRNREKATQWKERAEMHSQRDTLLRNAQWASRINERYYLPSIEIVSMSKSTQSVMDDASGAVFEEESFDEIENAEEADTEEFHPDFIAATEAPELSDSIYSEEPTPVEVPKYDEKPDARELPGKVSAAEDLEPSTVARPAQAVRQISPPAGLGSRVSSALAGMLRRIADRISPH